MIKCPCCSGLEYENCCQTYHTGLTIADTTESLVRSRFSAYALDDSEYIINTTHPGNNTYNKDIPDWKSHITEFSENTNFENLVITSASDRYIIFTAFLSYGEEDGTFSELSEFKYLDGKLLYFAGTTVDGGNTTKLEQKFLELIDPSKD